VADPVGLVTEFTITSAVFVPLLIIMVALVASDPGSLDYNNIVQWEWALLVAVLFVFIVEMPVPLYRTLQERWTRMNHERLSKSLSVSGTKRLDLVTALVASPVIRQRFADFCADYFCVESVRFVSDVIAFKEFYPNRRPEAILKKARAIGNLYIADAAILQVNLPFEIHQDVMKNILAGEISRDMFGETFPGFFF